MGKKQKIGLGRLFTTREMDIPFLILVLTILTIGLIMLFSASYTYAYYDKGSSTYFFVRQLIFAALGIAVMLFISKVDYRFFKSAAVIGYGVSLLLLVLVLFLPEVMPGFKRWILIPVIGITFQPSEVAKMMLIMYCARGLDKDHNKITGKGLSASPLAKSIMDATNGKLKISASFASTVFYGSSILITSGLVALEDHISGMILMIAIGVVMLWLGEFKRSWFIFGGVAAALAVALFVMKPDLLKEYAGERIVAWLEKDYEPLGARWQINQSLFAIGSGGLLGAGLGNSMQKHLYVSEPQNDFIFSIVSEELGFIGSTIILILFALLVWRGITIGIYAKDKFGALLAMGMVFQVGLQVILNVAVVTDTIPNTGIGLPFFSSGGTSLLILLAEMGVILSVSRFSRMGKITSNKENAKPERRRGKVS
ncbi:MAG: Lipid II flippase FtsW [Firmicutes bacterium ADurb.Bin300]|nr:MAG: Lipid II flippase FtsW [Firmicutes bacterium ADurb.Bin300]